MCGISTMKGMRRFAAWDAKRGPHYTAVTCMRKWFDLYLRQIVMRYLNY